MMKSSDLKQAFKILKQIQSITHFLEDEKMKMSNPFKLDYGPRTFNAKIIDDQFGGDEAFVETLAIQMDDFFRKSVYELRAKKIAEFELMGIEFIPSSALETDTDPDEFRHG